MGDASQSRDSKVLNSWKEIAAYLGKGVRTVQRYERELALPVRRPRGRSRSAVIALTSELDEWIRIAPRLEAQHPSSSSVVAALRQSVHETAVLRQLCSELRAQNQEAMRTLYANIHQMQELLHMAQQTRSNLAEFPGKSGGASFRGNPAKPH